ncbi:MAG: hypothetical protein ACREVL_09230 [Solimonas sp.]
MGIDFDEQPGLPIERMEVMRVGVHVMLCLHTADGGLQCYTLTQDVARNLYLQLGAALDGAAR